MGTLAPTLSTDRPSCKPMTDWRLYAAAGAAALAATSAADAAIITNNLNVDVKLAGPAPYRSESAQQTFVIGGFKGTAIVRDFNGSSYQPAHKGSAGITGIAIFRSNSSAQGALRFTSKQNAGGASAGHAFLNYNNGTEDFGNFNLGTTGLAGFELPNGDLGSLRVEVLDRNNDTYPDELKILGYAYNDVPGAAVTAGAADNGGSVPEPSALGLLAMGSAGVLAWRRRRTDPQTASNSEKTAAGR